MSDVRSVKSQVCPRHRPRDLVEESARKRKKKKENGRKEGRKVRRATGCGGSRAPVAYLKDDFERRGYGPLR